MHHPLVDLDGTLVRLAIDWDIARAEGRRRNLGGTVGRALIADPDGNFHRWLDGFETQGAIHRINDPLHEYLSGRSWALVTNNGVSVVAAAVAARAVDRPTVVVARSYGRPLKPSPEPLITAARQLRVNTRTCVYIGDRQSDAEAASAAGMPFRHVEDFCKELNS